jgi:hypothetical protein
MKFIHCPPVKLKELESQTDGCGSRFYLLEDGSKLPSVTTVLGARPKPQLHAWRKKVGNEEADRITRISSGRGRGLHTISEDYIKNVENPLKDAMPDALVMFKSIQPIIDQHIQNIYYQEETIYSRTLGLAGRLDLCCEWDGIPSIVDFKNSRKIKKKEWITDYLLQTTAYSLMVTELTGIPIQQIVILMAVENERPQLFIEKPRNYIPGLVKAIKYYRDLQEEQLV